MSDSKVQIDAEPPTATTDSAPATAPAAAPTARGRTLRRTVGAIAAVAILYGVFDLAWPRAHSLRDFDADEVARLDTDMWRSYYARERLLLFRQAAELLRTQYGMLPVRSYLVAFFAAKSAFVFKEGKSRPDYEGALPDLVRFFEAVKRDGDVEFDVDEAARLELEWWIVHRQRADHAPGDLAAALADAAAAVYGIPSERLLDYGRLRAEAMEIRDTKAAAGGVTEEDWAKIGELLRYSWGSLHSAVNAKG
jgi:hypothetical protein